MSTFDPMRHSGGTSFYRGIRIEGMDGLMKNLKKLLTSHTDAEIRKALSPATKIIIAAAKARAVVAKGVIKFKLVSGEEMSIPPGLLRDSIKILPKWRPDPLGIYVGPIVKRGKKAGGKVQPYYAHWMEYGVAAHNLGYSGKHVKVTGANHPGVHPKPYMRPAYDSTKEAVMRKMEEGIINMLEAKHF